MTDGHTQSQIHTNRKVAAGGGGWGVGWGGGGVGKKLLLQVSNL